MLYETSFKGLYYLMRLYEITKRFTQKKQEKKFSLAADVAQSMIHT